MTAGTPARRSRLEQLAETATPARLFIGGAADAYSTATSLELQADHAAARAAVHEELRAESGVWSTCPVVDSRATSRAEHLRRPDLGRLLSHDAAARVAALVTEPSDLQVVLGDGLSTPAVTEHAPAVLDGLKAEAARAGLRVAPMFAVRHCRVGILNEIGPLVTAPVVILLIGERPGLRVSASLSAYFAWRPQAGHTDADRNLISNIHARGVRPDLAGRRIVDLASQLYAARRSGVEVKEIRSARPSEALDEPRARG